MFKVYLESPLGDGEKKIYIRELLDLGWKREAEIQLESGYQCCINTELNSTNLLINGEGKSNYLIDWEKPLFGNPAQIWDISWHLRLHSGRQMSFIPQKRWRSLLMHTSKRWEIGLRQI